MAADGEVFIYGYLVAELHKTLGEVVGWPAMIAGVRRGDKTVYVEIAPPWPGRKQWHVHRRISPLPPLVHQPVQDQPPASQERREYSSAPQPSSEYPSWS